MKIGKVSENVLKRSILQQIKTKRDEVMIGAGLGEDCAIFSFDEGICRDKSDGSVTISCMLESSGSVENLITDCVNRLAAKGAEPVAIGLHVLLPADAKEEVLKDLFARAEKLCTVLRVEIAQASARVSEAVNREVMTVVSYGRAARGGCRYTFRETRPGQDIVISKWIGLRGTATLAAHFSEEIQERYPKWICDEALSFEQHLSTVPEAATAIKSGVCTMLNVSEGGILASLWELAEGAGVGLTIDLKKLPIRQETVEICNHLNVNPYELSAGGCLLMTTEDGQKLADALAEEGIPAVIVGRITDSKDRLILNEDEVRYLDRPHADSLYGKIFQ